MDAELFQEVVMVIIVLLEKTRERKLFVCVKKEGRLIDFFNSNCFHCFGTKTLFVTALCSTAS